MCFQQNYLTKIVLAFISLIDFLAGSIGWNLMCLRDDSQKATWFLILQLNLLVEVEYIKTEEEMAVGVFYMLTNIQSGSMSFS